MKLPVLFAALIGFVLGLALAVKGISMIENDPDSFQGKAEWALLQGIEYDSRNKPIAEIEFVDRDNYHLICIPDRGTRVWIMLNPIGTPYYKQMPGDENFSITQAEYDKIQSTHLASLTVMACLNSHIEDTLPVHP